MSLFFISLGSNLSPEKNIPACLSLLKKTFNLKKISSVYETSPVGPAGENLFWNMTAQIESGDSRNILKKKLRKIENRLGRLRTPGDKFAPRTIDLDLLPQANDQKQAFVIIPLAEIAPEALDMETGFTYKALAEALRRESRQKIRKIS